MCLNTDLGAAAQPREQPPVGDAKFLPAVSAGQHPLWVSVRPVVLWAPHYEDPLNGDLLQGQVTRCRAATWVLGDLGGRRSRLRLSCGCDWGSHEAVGLSAHLAGGKAEASTVVSQAEVALLLGRDLARDLCVFGAASIPSSKSYPAWLSVFLDEVTEPHKAHKSRRPLISAARSSSQVGTARCPLPHLTLQHQHRYKTYFRNQAVPR